MHPGWYDDPWSPAALRWWDGTQWTAHTAPRPAPGWGSQVRLAPDIDGAARAARRASIAVVVTAVLACVQVLLLSLILHSVVHDFVHQLHQYSNDLNTDPNAQLHLNVARIYLLDLIGLPSLAAEVVFIVWFAKAATNAERLGLPHARAPLWAILGFFVPIVNFWFPYQVARDLFEPGDPERSTVKWWWALTLIQSIPIFAVFVVSYFSTAAAALIAVAACVMPVMVAVYARRIIAAVTHRHAQLAAR